MRPGDLARIRPSGWTATMYATPHDRIEAQHKTTDQLEGGEMVTVVETCDSDGFPLGPYMEVRVISPRGVVGYVPLSRLERVR